MQGLFQINGVLDKVKEMKGKLEQTVDPPKLVMRCCMLGSRGVGKTSVITSMYGSQKQTVSDTNLFLVADAQTEQILNGKKLLLEDMFRGVHAENELVTEPGLPGDSAESVFQFTYGMHSERINIDLEIRDYPGEYLLREPETVAEFIEEADAVIVAIDTPALMEADGRFHEGKNRPKQVSDFLKNHLSDEKEKLVLLVPLKCEKYYADGNIDDVTKRIRQEYQPLIQDLKGRRNPETNKKTVCCAITPIQTLGGIVFDSFGKDASGNVSELTTRDGCALPERVEYRYVSTGAKYEPMYCEQPLCYLLGFVAKQYDKARQAQGEGGFWGRLKKKMRLIPNIEEFRLEMAALSQRKLTDSQGFQVLFGRGKI